jgi:hypothetical protein
MRVVALLSMTLVACSSCGEAPQEAGTLAGTWVVMSIPHWDELEAPMLQYKWDTWYIENMRGPQYTVTSEKLGTFEGQDAEGVDGRYFLMLIKPQTLLEIADGEIRGYIHDPENPGEHKLIRAHQIITGDADAQTQEN